MYKKLFIAITVFAAALAVSGCSKNDKRSDAFGNFEAVETIVSSESSGKLVEFNVEEGSILDANYVAGYIDTVQLNLKKKQLEATKNLTRTKFKNVSSQIAVYQEQKRVALKERDRIERLLKDNAATGKQLDDINGNIDVINKQIAAVETQNNTTNEELKNYDVQIKQIEDQLGKSSIINPVKGTVIMKYVEPNEVVSFGKPLYKIADLSVMELRVYVSGTQLPEIKIGQNVKVLIDNGKDGFTNMEGEISWISSKAEFTPKIIQTKEERVNLVYAVKVRVKNDGAIKIGMPGEVVFK
ncbi:MAG: HlyD family efflux transporter periplasmic adaptor subunit [Bacteroidetes bacterium]|nr:HlyD family efflux transporter periplasmic adaptor subunit [Bacteroidota bacterium]